MRRRCRTYRRQLLLADGDYRVVGLPTNIAFLRECVRHPAFQKGGVDTGFLETGEYRLRFLVDSGNRTNDSLDIDQIRLEQRLLDDGDILETGQVEVFGTT